MLSVDRRVGSIDLAPLIRAHLPGVKVKVTTLNFGDIAFTGNGPEGRPVRIGIEVKKVPDLLQSMTNGRLQAHQVTGMLDSYELNWLLVEGAYRPAYGSGALEVPRKGGWGSSHVSVTYRQMDTFLCGLEVAGIKFRRTWDREETALVIADIYRYWAKAWDDHETFHTFDQSRQFTSLKRPNQTVRVAASLDGIGWVRAHDVARKFGSIGRMMAASQAEWEGVKGIGKVTAAKVIRAIRGK